MLTIHKMLTDKECRFSCGVFEIINHRSEIYVFTVSEHEIIIDSCHLEERIMVGFTTDFPYDLEANVLAKLNQLMV